VVSGEACAVSVRIHRKPPSVPGFQSPDTSLEWTVQEGLSDQRCFRILNPGSAPLDLNAAADSTGSAWISVDPGKCAVPPGGADSIRIGVHADRLFQGFYESALWLRTNLVSDSLIRVPVRLSVIDTIPPAAIDDLEIIDQGGDTLALLWSAPGDNRLLGRATEYEILAESSDGIPESTETVLLEKMSPAAVGKPEKAVLPLDRLSLFHESWIMIRTLDDAGLSSISNRVRIPRTLSGAGSARALPEKTRLNQNYPNPFNASTRIGFNIERASEIELVVLDASGRIVAPLCQGRFSAGRHEVFWNATDRNGRAVTSGVYLIRIKTPDHFEMKKMLLLR
jgi:hypothetical protein